MLLPKSDRLLNGNFAMHELRDKGIFATRQLAKRQITCLRSMPERHVVACDAPDALEQVLALVDASYRQAAIPKNEK